MSTPQEVAAALAYGHTSLADVDASATPGFTGGKSAGKKALAGGADRLGELQEMLYASAASGESKKAVVLVLQGRDTAGKGGIVKHVVSALSPHGVRTTSFGVPTPEEAAHPFLWRIMRALPPFGSIGVFDRSHYEDILAVRMHGLAEESVWSARYEQINEFEEGLVADGITLVKVMLTISREEQEQRLRERLERPDKFWKFNPSDIDDRLVWDEYTAAFQDVLDRTSTQAAPWYVVPADRKWYARWAVANLLTAALEGLSLRWPAASFDVAEQLARLDDSTRQIS